MHIRPRIAALLEVLGVYLSGNLVAALLSHILGLQPVNPLTTLSAEVTDAELITATRQLFVLLMLQYAGWFLLIIPINWWHRRQGRAAYGLTKADHSWMTLLLLGLCTAALAGWPILSINLVDAIYGLGETVPWRAALFAASWRRWEFWLFTAVLSWALVPLVEELFFRGYCQRRLAEDWGNGGAIIGTTCLFVFSHSQYMMLNAYNVGVIATGLVLGIGFGVVFAWTRSLVPSVVAHAVINVPMTPLWLGVLVAALVIGAVIAAERGAAVVSRVFSGASVAGCAALGLVGIGYPIVSRRFNSFEFVGAAMVVLAVGLEAMDGGGMELGW